MSYLHKGLAGGRWKELTFTEQMANIGSEVGRAIKWRVKNNDDHSRRAFERALELLDLTLDTHKEPPRLKEVARLREAIVGYFTGNNQFKLTDESLNKYFMKFTYAARRKSQPL